MSAITNPGFEDAGTTPGSADGWTLTTLATLEEIAGFDSTTPQAFEDFEEEWSSNEDFEFDWDDVTEEQAIFDSSLGATALQGVEDFEEGWSSNEDFEFGLGSVEAAEFDSGTPQDFEDFEEEWSDNENFFFAWDPSVPNAIALWSPASKPTEDFEEEWKSNEDFRVDWADVVANAEDDDLTFTHGDDTEAFDDDDVEVSVPLVFGIGVGAPVEIDSGLFVVVEIEGSFAATFQVQGKLLNTWVDFGTPLTTAGTIDLPTGVSEVRIETTAYSSGTPTARYVWGRMTTI